MPKAERVIWYECLCKQKTGYKFMRQKPIGNYIVDFYCSSLKIIIEIDGDSHLDTQKYDRKRSKYLNQMGYEVLRFDNNQVMIELEKTKRQLQRELYRQHVNLVLN